MAKRLHDLEVLDSDEQVNHTFWVLGIEVGLIPPFVTAYDVNLNDVLDLALELIQAGNEYMGAPQ